MELDGRSDLYALGVTAFFALTGRLPFESASIPALVTMHLLEPAPPVASLRPGIPPRLAEAVDRCLAKEPSARFATAEALADLLGEMAVEKTTPPSILKVRSEAGTAVTLLLGPAFFILLLGPHSPEWVLPIAVVWGFLGLAALVSFLSSASDVLRAGHDLGDVVAAERQIVAASLSDRNAAWRREEWGGLARYMARPRGRVFNALLGGLVGLQPAAHLVEFLRSAGEVLPAPGALPGLVTMAGMSAWLLTGAARGRLPGFPKGDPAVVGGAVAVRRWDNPFMRLIFRVAGIGVTSRGAAGPAVEQGATEIFLGRAAGELFLALSDGDRARLGDVLRVIRELERAAAALRKRRDTLERAIAQAGAVGPGAESKRAEVVAGLEAAKATASERLRQMVAALENLRLDLLRLRAGVGNAAEITGAVEAARQIGLAVAAELEGRAEGGRLAGAP